VRDGGEPLDVRTEEPDEHLRLCLAQLGEICCDMRDRAVVLADLDAGAGLLRGRGVAVGGERRSQLSRTPISGDPHQRSRVAGLQTVQALAGEGAHGGVAAGVYSDLDQASAACVRVTDIIDPVAAWVEPYREAWRCFRDYYPALRSVK